jgi:hypothetical protein
MKCKAVLVAAALACAAGCATNIKPQDQTIVPPKVALSRFAAGAILPTETDRSDSDEGDRRAIQRIGEEFTGCMRTVFPNLRTARSDENFPPSTLLVAPRIEDMSKKTVAERVFLGPLAGSSAVLSKTTYTNAADRNIVAAPVFYARQTPGAAPSRSAAPIT